ncbi:MAG: site-2 protease family protein [Candidatus Marinimicrobia bacterium]|jgi:membrane-associated protease RseP (regulator of RpoE activity)|nr:site-2 protease family protein [Candidatus Neomarinimicrobiota bacterium]MCK9559807.1 site-2 protease family protein [Candidatus Neomarinimicrobiota bacterium]MDD5230457.1 site-2 protease family protein [Candidatus Neomarinimicrobiota bacterium]MDD5540357.1 site-2 protease family protein [Candidatus Neomarinimicrobiota bacterium]
MLDETTKQNIISYLSQWIEVIRVREEGWNLVIEGRQRDKTSLRSIARHSGGLIHSIKKFKDNQADLFLIKTIGTERRISKIHLILFLLTVYTTLMAGAMMEGANPFTQPLTVVKGIPFSLTLLAILGVHELGHFSFARKHHVDATLPYFIPAPTFIGTFGAFIKMRSPVRQRRALLEIGAAGPIFGFLVATPALFIGLALSEVVPLAEADGIQLGDSIIMKIASAVIFPGLEPGQDILLHPVGFAAWIGMLVTMLNLLPIGQLDGGHIAHALLGKKSIYIAWGALIATGALAFLSLNWLVWGALVFFLVRVKHPPIIDDYKPLTVREKLIGLTALTIFILTFIPVPFKT